MKIPLNKHITEKVVKFDKHKRKMSKWITRAVINSISLRDKLYNKLKQTKPDTLEPNTLKINLSTYNKILKIN